MAAAAKREVLLALLLPSAALAQESGDASGSGAPALFTGAGAEVPASSVEDFDQYVLPDDYESLGGDAYETEAAKKGNY